MKLGSERYARFAWRKAKAPPGHVLHTTARRWTAVYNGFGMYASLTGKEEYQVVGLESSYGENGVEKSLVGFK